ncbi:SulP family inorganic anion transporter [Oerskovia sp. M15]
MGADAAADLIAGIAVAALLIPESMGYAGVAGVPPQVGLYAALAAVFAYAVTGGTSILVVGPASAVAALSASIVAAWPKTPTPSWPPRHWRWRRGCCCCSRADAVRVDRQLHLPSRPARVRRGLSISIIIGQLGGLFGVEVEGDSAVSKLVDTFRNIGEWQPATVVVGLASVVVLLLLNRFARSSPVPSSW